MTGGQEPPRELSDGASVREIEQDIEETRERLGGTVEALTGRLAAQARPVAYVAIGVAVAAGLVVVVAWWRRR